MEGWASASKVRDRSQSRRGRTKTEEHVSERREPWRCREGGKEWIRWGARAGGVQIKPSSGGINLSWVCFRAGVVEGQALCCGLWKFSTTSRHPVCGPPVTHNNNTHSNKHKTHGSRNSAWTQKHLNTDVHMISLLRPIFAPSTWQSSCFLLFRTCTAYINSRWFTDH